MKLLKGYRKYLYERDTIFATISVFLVIGLLALLPLNTGILNPVKKAFADFDFNDLAYTKLGKNANTKLDSNIVIVNIGHADRATIAGVLEMIAAKKPKVIGLDVYFEEAKEPESDSLLRTVLFSIPNLVMASRVWDKQGVFKENKGYFNSPKATYGYVNIPGEERGLIRYHTPVEVDKGKEYLSFPTTILKFSHPEAFTRLLARDKELETINYSRNIDKYLPVEGEDILSGSVNDSVFMNKIVLVGYLNASQDDIEDKYFTPLNPKMGGKSLPDMNGMVIQANFLSMAINNQYIKTSPYWLNWLITILIAWLHVSLFIRYYIDAHLWFHLVAKTAQIISAIFFVYLSVMCFSYFNLKIDMKMPVTVIILAIDIIYFYEAFAVWMHEKTGFKTIFHHKH
jgi:CHASE2 domain-containing sensor protein